MSNCSDTPVALAVGLLDPLGAESSAERRTPSLRLDVSSAGPVLDLALEFGAGAGWDVERGAAVGTAVVAGVAARVAAADGGTDAGVCGMAEDSSAALEAVAAGECCGGACAVCGAEGAGCGGGAQAVGTCGGVAPAAAAAESCGWAPPRQAAGTLHTNAMPSPPAVISFEPSRLKATAAATWTSGQRPLSNTKASWHSVCARTRTNPHRTSEWPVAVPTSSPVLALYRRTRWSP